MLEELDSWSPSSEWWGEGLQNQSGGMKTPEKKKERRIPKKSPCHPGQVLEQVLASGASQKKQAGRMKRNRERDTAMSFKVHTVGVVLPFTAVETKFAGDVSQNRGCISSTVKSVPTKKGPACSQMETPSLSEPNGPRCMEVLQGSCSLCEGALLL